MIFRKFIELLYLGLMLKRNDTVSLPFPVLTVRGTTEFQHGMSILLRIRIRARRWLIRDLTLYHPIPLC